MASITRTATPVAAAMSNTSPQATATVRARLIQFCRESVLAKGECRKSESSFNRRLARAKDVDVFGVWHLDDLSGANSITMQWTVNGTPHPPAVCTLSGNQCKEANVSPVKSNIPTTEPGDYRLDVIADGQPVLTGSFKVD